MIRKYKYFVSYSHSAGFGHVVIKTSYLIDDEKYINSIINIANPKNYKIQTIITVIDKYFNKKSNYKVIEKGSEPLINTTTAEDVISILKIEISEGYIEKLLSKYFPKK